MSDNKKYYYLKIKENFYDTEDIKILQSMDNGYLYSYILMKLYLKSLKSEGKVMFKDHIPYNCNMIATVTGHNTVIVEKSLSIFKELWLIDILDNGAIFMLDIQNFGKWCPRRILDNNWWGDFKSRLSGVKMENKTAGYVVTNYLPAAYGG